jgi:hypothetical protein
MTLNKDKSITPDCEDIQSKIRGSIDSYIYTKGRQDKYTFMNQAMLNLFEKNY